MNGTRIPKNTAIAAIRRTHISKSKIEHPRKFPLSQRWDAISSVRVWPWLLIDEDDRYPACRICWKLSSVLPGKASTGSCHTLAASLKLLTGRLGEAIYWEMPCPLHSLWSFFMGAAGPMHSRSGVWEKQGNDAGKAPWAEGLSREEQP